MKHLIPVFLLAARLFAQTAVITPTVTASTMTITLSGGALPADAQWLVASSSGLAFSNPQINPSLGAAGFVLKCNATNTDCLIYSLNHSTIPNGTLATFTATGTMSGTVTVSGTVTAAISASEVASSGASFSFPPPSTCKEDLNADGLLNTTDATLEAGVVVNGPCDPAHDFNGDGKCNALDQQIMANAVFTGACQ